MATIIVSPMVSAQVATVKKQLNKQSKPYVSLCRADVVIVRNPGELVIWDEDKWMAITPHGSWETEVGEGEESEYKKAKSILQRMKFAQQESSTARQQHLLATVKVQTLEKEIETLKKELEERPTRRQIALQKQVFTFSGMALLFVILSLLFGNGAALSVDKMKMEYSQHFPQIMCELDLRTGPFLEKGEGNGTVPMREILDAMNSNRPVTFKTGDLDYVNISDWCWASGMGPQDCVEYLQMILIPRTCIGGQVLNLMEKIRALIDWIKYLFNYSQEMMPSLIMDLLLICLMMYQCWHAKPAIALRMPILVLVCRFVFKIPMFILSLAMTWMNLGAFLVMCIAMVLNVETQIFLFLLHWSAQVAWYVLKGDNLLIDVSQANFQTILSPLISFLAQFFNRMHVTTIQQIAIVTSITSISVGLQALWSKVVVTGPDGKSKTFMKITSPVKSVWRWMRREHQQRRGVVPAFPYSGDKLILVECEGATGVAWRFGNNVFTVGHVVPPGVKTVTAFWKDKKTVLKVKRHIPISSCGDHITVMGLNSDLVGVEPFRRSKATDSTYGTLWFLSEDREPMFFAGWLQRDNEFLTSCFCTQHGVSGGPYCDQFGRIVGVHLGSQGLLSTGVWLPPYYNQMDDAKKEEVKREQKVMYCWPDGSIHEEPYKPPETIEKKPEVMSIPVKQAEVVRIPVPLEPVVTVKQPDVRPKQLELPPKEQRPPKKKKDLDLKIEDKVESTDKVNIREECDFCDVQVGLEEIYDIIVDTVRKNIGHLSGQVEEMREMLLMMQKHQVPPPMAQMEPRWDYEEDEMDEAAAGEVEEFMMREEKKKGRTKYRARLMRAGNTKDAAYVRKVKNEFKKMKVLTEREYKHLQEQGKTKEEIKCMVDGIREQKFREWCIDNDVDDPDDPDDLDQHYQEKDEAEQLALDAEYFKKRAVEYTNDYVETERWEREQEDRERKRDWYRDEKKKKTQQAFRYGRKKQPPKIFCWSCQEEHVPGQHTSETVLCKKCKAEVTQKEFPAHSKACGVEAKNES